MQRTRLRRFAAILVGCGAAGLLIGWSYAENPAVNGAYWRTLGR